MLEGLLNVGQQVLLPLHPVSCLRYEGSYQP